MCCCTSWLTTTAKLLLFHSNNSTLRERWLMASIWLLFVSHAHTFACLHVWLTSLLCVNTSLCIYCVFIIMCHSYYLFLFIMVNNCQASELANETFCAVHGAAFVLPDGRLSMTLAFNPYGGVENQIIGVLFLTCNQCFMTFHAIVLHVVIHCYNTYHDYCNGITKYVLWCYMFSNIIRL